MNNVEKSTRMHLIQDKKTKNSKYISKKKLIAHNFHQN